MTSISAKEDDSDFERVALLTVLKEVRQSVLDDLGEDVSSEVTSAIDKTMSGTLGAVEGMHEMSPNFKFTGIAVELSKSLYGDVNS